MSGTTSVLVGDTKNKISLRIDGVTRTGLEYNAVCNTSIPGHELCSKSEVVDLDAVLCRSDSLRKLTVSTPIQAVLVTFLLRSLGVKKARSLCEELLSKKGELRLPEYASILKSCSEVSVPSNADFRKAYEQRITNCAKAKQSLAASGYGAVSVQMDLAAGETAEVLLGQCGRILEICARYQGMNILWVPPPFVYEKAVQYEVFLDGVSSMLQGTSVIFAATKGFRSMVEISRYGSSYNSQTVNAQGGLTARGSRQLLEHLREVYSLPVKYPKPVLLPSSQSEKVDTSQVRHQKPYSVSPVRKDKKVKKRRLH